MLLTDRARAVIRQHPKLRGRIVTAKDVAYQARLAAIAAISAPIVIEDEFGIKILIPPYMRRTARHQLHRPSDRAAFGLMAQTTKPGDTVLDVGANIGVYSIHAAHLVGPTGLVHAFEAVPSTAGRLHETIALNHCHTRITVANVAVSDTDGVATMYTHTNPKDSGWASLGTHSMYDFDGTERKPGQAVDVPAVTLDSYCQHKRVDTIAFCKVDVEGFERAVFAGARQLLADSRIGILAFEISEDPLAGNGDTPLDVFTELAGHAYHIYQHDEKTGELVGPVDPGSESRRLTNGPLHPYVANYFATRRPKLLTTVIP
ncbi:FkbM family methyltransferase [Pseudofrankia sp. BMG5.37]|uniref:FkbM family methyltransferase n=1 Tax=Pseudofrankia sp. BMG5.37 TaxID=3050035 RepID=UPI002894860A|nr:FkbM family methyltransferase [Pseudofrankia sp. BMG5.37]MDT3440129.1 FkbM family methyltransferase [Pseudofrankia sp. BMG5.37]